MRFELLSATLLKRGGRFRFSLSALLAFEFFDLDLRLFSFLSGRRAVSLR